MGSWGIVCWCCASVVGCESLVVVADAVCSCIKDQSSVYVASF